MFEDVNNYPNLPYEPCTQNLKALASTPTGEKDMSETENTREDVALCSGKAIQEGCLEVTFSLPLMFWKRRVF